MSSRAPTEDAVPVLPLWLQGPGASLVFSRESIRQVDRAAAEEFGLPTIVLMENASIALAAGTLALLDGRTEPVFILCGPGNNGGDGLALARRLDNLGVSVVIGAARPLADLKGDAAVNASIVRAMGLTLEPIHGDDPSGELDSIVSRQGEPAVIVDALFGTGLDKPPKPPFDGLIHWVNGRRPADPALRVLSVDCPSGLDCDAGEPLVDSEEGAIVADLTITLGGHKRGLLSPRASRWTGRVEVGDIGAPREALRRYGSPLEPGPAQG